MKFNTFIEVEILGNSLKINGKTISDIEDIIILLQEERIKSLSRNILCNLDNISSGLKSTFK